MDGDINQKYRIAELPLDGRIAEVGGLIPYRNGNGYFRNVVLAVAGVLDTPAYVPVTVFGTDATDLDPQLDLERPMQCTGRLTSRRYLDRNGNVRWALSLTATGVMLGPRKTMDPQGVSRDDATALADAAEVPDDWGGGGEDIPF